MVVLRISGSPFQYTVGRSAAGGTHKVDFGGVGVDKGQVGIKSKYRSDCFTVQYYTGTGDSRKRKVYTKKAKLEAC